MADDYEDYDIMEYSEYYTFTTTGPGGEEKIVRRYVTSGDGPSHVLVGNSQQQISFSDFQKYQSFGRSNTLWIEGENSWTEYASVPEDSTIGLLFITPQGGSALLYQVYPDGTIEETPITLYSNSRMDFYADTPGEHQLYFVLNGQPSNTVTVDVKATSPFSGFGSNWAMVNLISSAGLKGYDIYIDNVFALTEGQGAVPDGTARFPVRGDSTHKITIRKDGQTYGEEKYFETGKEYNLYF
jgi:hypothetical protein